MTARKLPARRPAETAGATGSAAALVGLALGLDEGLVAALVAIAGILPAVATWIVDHGGLRGLWRRLVNGRP